ncbi:MAG: recombinase family protein [Methanomassiliicoccales archaeon]|nr:recombinase family protein [Methanomassiliicoccales archaeon]NYT16359.1 recombinase family protein [Methanomassiliicoccales archaeon]
MSRVAIYTRVSTDDQAKEGYSLDAQKERLEAYCEAQGWTITDFYVDEGHSGRNTQRPEYQRMIEQRDSWDTILVLKMDRIHRNSKNFMIMMENLESWGKKFASMQESLDTSNAVGRFVVDIIQRIAQLESEQIGERTYMGMKQKAESGDGLLGFRIPYGYELKEDGLAPEEFEAEKVRHIFKAYLAGQTMDWISWDLNRQDIPTKKDNLWTLWSISRILHNPVYAGFLRWDNLIISSQHKPLVSIEDFNEVQRIIASRIKNPKHQKFIELPMKKDGVSSEGELTIQL